ncbi:MAG: recombinase family protein, partial [Sporomusaceae bacterium]|nr:recombinase family protein [Sporomusaceae bacterium]
MARTKNRLAPEAACNVLRWDAGKYIRLSKEDLGRGNDESNSVRQQRKLLDEYCLEHPDEFRSAREFSDDGCTGTDTNREGFQNLLAAVMSRKINCVIVKDLSRLSRNYSDAGSLIENLFVQMKVRFISLAEGIDSYKKPDSVNNLLVPLTNVMNDNFCYQTSQKIRQVFDYKRRKGEFIGGFAVYGYLKDPQNKHALIIDAEAAEVVRN